jgi:hypothetical protein
MEFTTLYVPAFPRGFPRGNGAIEIFLFKEFSLDVLGCSSVRYQFQLNKT